MSARDLSKNWIRTELELRKREIPLLYSRMAQFRNRPSKLYKGISKDKVKFYTDSYFTKRLRSWEKFLGSSTPVTITISKSKTELEKKLDWFVFKGSGAILRAYKFLYENGLL